MYNKHKEQINEHINKISESDKNKIDEMLKEGQLTEPELKPLMENGQVDTVVSKREKYIYCKCSVEKERKYTFQGTMVLECPKCHDWEFAC